MIKWVDEKNADRLAAREDVREARAKA